MHETLISKALRKDREIREARFGFGLAAWLFSLWGMLRLPTLAVFTIPDMSLVQKGYAFTLTVLVLAVAFITIRRFVELGKIRSKLAKNPELADDIKVSGPPVLNTIIPFLLK